MTAVTISQPRYLPACNYIHRMALSDIFIYLDTVKYSPRDWENRNKIKLSSGKSAWMTVPVVHTHREQRIVDTMIHNEDKWALKHLHTITHSYCKAKYFQQYIDFFKDAYSRNWRYLADLNIYLVDFIVKTLGIDCTFVKASELDGCGRGQELLIDLCQKVGADLYISGPLGRQYIDRAGFDSNHLKLFYHDYQHPVYPQMHGEFLSYMSVIDLLFNCGEESLEYLKQGNISKKEMEEAQ